MQLCVGDLSSWEFPVQRSCYCQKDGFHCRLINGFSVGRILRDGFGLTVDSLREAEPESMGQGLGLFVGNRSQSFLAGAPRVTGTDKVQPLVLKTKSNLKPGKAKLNGKQY